MHILFLYVGLPIGGIETLLVRLSKTLDLTGARVSVLFATRQADEGLLSQLSKHANIAYLDQFLLPGPWRPIQEKPLLRFSLPINASALKGWLVDTPDISHAADVGALLLAARLQTVANIGKLTAGVYHDREYLFEDKNNYFVNTAKNIFKNLPIENVIFFNEKSALIHSKRFSKDYSKSTITPIGIATENLEYLPLVNKSNKVISIGRLTPFKTYNSCMIDAIARLKTKGIILNYEIYGTGECEKSLKDKIQQLDLQDQVQLKGDISYDRIKEVLNGALAFVGSGTALIEASAAGVPSIIGIEHATDSATYGFLHSTSGLSYHDAGLGYPLTTFDSCLQALVEGSNSDLAIHSNLAKNRAKDFSIERTTKDFLNLSARATTIKNPIHLNVIDCLKINASMINLRLLASCGKARFFDRHSNVTSS